MMQNKQKMKIAFFGDSLTEGTIGASYFKMLEEKLSEKYDTVEYINLQEVIIKKLSSRIISSYMPTSNTGIFFDYFTLKNDEEIDKKSSERGLHFTIDGAHLNSYGAKIVADVFYRKLKEIV